MLQLQCYISPSLRSAFREVFQLLKGQDSACRGARHIKYCGHLLCNRGFMRMFGLGKHRFHTLSSAARHGHQHCPFDGRYIAKGPKPQSPEREAVHQFLMELYVQAAEPIPDGLNSNKRPRQGLKRFDQKGLDRSKMKHLPPGSINDYYVQCVAANPGMTISRKLFSSES